MSQRKAHALSPAEEFCVLSIAAGGESPLNDGRDPRETPMATDFTSRRFTRPLLHVAVAFSAVVALLGAIGVITWMRVL
jgi:hypothetical protein